MNTMHNKGLIAIAALAAALVLFFAVNIVAGRTLTNVRTDLTEGKLYTLSKGSKGIAASLQEPIKLTLYLTQKSANDVAPVKAYSQRVKELLTEYARTSGGKVKLTITDPEPFSDQEDQAVAAGIAGLATGRGEDRLYFGLVATNAVDRTEVIPFFDPAKEEFLEYDVAKLISQLSDKPRKTIGLMSWLPVQGMEQNPMTQGRGTPPWQIYKRLQDTFDVKPVATNAKEISPEIKTLVVVHPKNMSEPTQYAIDQFVLRGGRVLLFVDPHCESDVPPGMNQFQAMQVPKNSDVPKLMGAWGVELEPGKIAADMNAALQVPVGQGNRQETAPYVVFLELTKERSVISSTDPVTGQLERIIVGAAGVLRKKDGATTEVQPLLTTTVKGSMIESSLISFVPDPKKLLAEYKPGDKALWLAVRITGKSKSAFPDGPPKTDPSVEGDKNAPPATPLPHVAEAAESIGVIVAADCDMLSDQFWIRESRLGNLLLGYNEVSDNGAFTTGAVDNLSGSSDLMGLRARGKFARPFTRIQDLEREAQQRYHATEEELKRKLTETEQKINALQKQRPDAKNAKLVMTPEQQREIDDFKQTMVKTRRDLRVVKFDLDKDTRSLQSRLMALNIGLMPAIIAVFALALAGYRASRRAADRQQTSKG